MWIQVRSMDGRKTVRVDDLSKLTLIEDLRQRLVDDFEAPPERQKLFYRGKLLIDGHKLFDYDVNRNDIIQIMVRPDIPKPEPTEEEETESKMEEKELDDEEPGTSESQENDVSTEGSTYKIGDIIDARDLESGAWFEAEIKKISKNNDTSNSKSKMTENEDHDKEECDSSSIKNEQSESYVSPDFYQEDDGFLYHIVYEGYEEDDPVKLPVKNVRPRARNTIHVDKVKIGDRLLVCHNMDEPKARGYWFDATITHKKITRTIKDIMATVYIGKDLVPVQDCQIMYWWDMMVLEKPGTQLNKNDPDSAAQSPSKRASKPDCDFCKDKPNKKCKECACRKCGGKDGPDKQILCDECEGAYHIWCLNPPLDSLPDDDEWFCPQCKNDASEIVQTGEKLKSSKKKAKMASVTGDCKRDWGKGMACVGRTQVCTIVPPNHFGPIPGVEVGTLWKFRLQVSEAGVHRPHVAGIHGREDCGAFSIVLSGGYEDDEDDGDQFTYTGSGGRDLSGNKRTAEQSCDQTLTRMNRALAKNCAANIDNKNGAEAADWKKGKPVRVVRNCKGRKHSNYAPEEGNRYDGIYKVVKYWPQKGQSGFIVWRYMLRRDDPNPAPWTKEGKKRIEKLSLTMKYPEGYLEKQENKDKENADETPSKSKKGKGKKRKKTIESDEENENEDLKPTSAKKSKVAEYKIESDIKKLIKGDKLNDKTWEQALCHTKEGGQVFLAKVEELFLCICCQDIVFKPVTTECSHNICKPCLQRSFKAEVYCCPACRTDLGKDHKMNVNQSLSKVLNDFFPGYEAGR